jgi:hypothetical protein
LKTFKSRNPSIKEVEQEPKAIHKTVAIDPKFSKRQSLQSISESSSNTTDPVKSVAIKTTISPRVTRSKSKKTEPLQPEPPRPNTPETLKKLQIESDRLKVNQIAIESAMRAETIMKSKTVIKASSIPSRTYSLATKSIPVLSPDSVAIPFEALDGVSPDTGSDDLDVVNIGSSPDSLTTKTGAPNLKNSPDRKTNSAISSNTPTSANSDGFIEIMNESGTGDEDDLDGFKIASVVSNYENTGPTKSNLPSPRKPKNIPETQEDDISVETERLMIQLQLQQQIRTLVQKNEDLLVAENQSQEELTLLKRSNEEKTKEINNLNELIVNSKQRDSNHSTYMHVSSKLEVTKVENQQLLLDIQSLNSEKLKLKEQVFDLKMEEEKNQDLLELSILDKCVAEESVELLKYDLKIAKDRIEELVLELDLNEPKKVQVTGNHQLQLQNERLKEALYLLRELSIKAELELKERVESKEVELKNLEEIREHCVKYKQNLLESDQKIEYLKAQLEDMNDSTDIITHLSTSNHDLNTTLTKKEKECLELQGLKEINDELESVHIEIQKRLYKELDLKCAIIEELKYRFSNLQKVLIEKQQDLEVYSSRNQNNQVPVSHEECEEKYRVLDLKYKDCLVEFNSLELMIAQTEFDKSALKKYLGDVEEDLSVIECVSGLKFVQNKSRFIVDTFVNKIEIFDVSDLNLASLIVSVVGCMNSASQNLLLLESMPDSKTMEYFLSLANNVKQIVGTLDGLKNGDLEYTKLELERLKIKSGFRVEYDSLFSKQLLSSIQVLVKCVNTEIQFMVLEMKSSEFKSYLDIFLESALKQISLIDRLAEYIWINKEYQI